MNQAEDIFYCIQADCKYPEKIITSHAQQHKHHNGHETNLISNLRKELQGQDTKYNALKPDSVNQKEVLLTFIDAEVDKLIKSFLTTIVNFGKQLRKFVNENLTSLKESQLLFKAVMENNIQQITLHQDHLEFLKMDNKFFEEQKELHELVREQISSTTNSTSDKIAALDKLDLPKPSLAKPSLVEIFEWSTTNKHPSVTFQGKLAQNQYNDGYNAVLLENQLSFQKVHTLKLKIVANKCDIMLHICDLKTIKTNSKNFLNIYQNGFGAYTHSIGGYIYGTDSYGQETTKSFRSAVGDIIELQWNGPKKQFTTHKVNTGEKFVFDVKYDANAELYFAVSFYYQGIVEIM